MSEDTDIGRRGFLGAGAAAVAATGLCGGCALFHKNTIHLDSEDADRIALPLEDFPKLREADGFVHVRARRADDRLVVLRTREGGVVALSMKCTHWGCDVDWYEEEQRFVCPCHGSRFDTEGVVHEGPADEPLRRFPVIDEGDVVYIDLASTSS